MSQSHQSSRQDGRQLTERRKRKKENEKHPLGNIDTHMHTHTHTHTSEYSIRKTKSHSQSPTMAVMTRQGLQSVAGAHSSKTKIANFGNAVCVKEDVLRLQVAMNNSLHVQICQPFCDLPKQAPDAVLY